VPPIWHVVGVLMCFHPLAIALNEIYKRIQITKLLSSRRTKPRSDLYINSVRGNRIIGIVV
jgi:hypothetical protein